MNRLRMILCLLLLTLIPAVIARAAATYPGWGFERALCGAGLRLEYTELDCWAVLPAGEEPTDALAGLAGELDMAAAATSTQPFADEPALMAASSDALLNAAARQADGCWQVVAQVTASADAAGWYQRLNAALPKLGRNGPVHITAVASIPGRIGDTQRTALITSITDLLLCRSPESLNAGPDATIISGRTGLVPRQAGQAADSRTFTLSLDYDQATDRTVVTLNYPGIR